VWTPIPDEHFHVPTVTNIPRVRGQSHAAKESWVSRAKPAQQVSDLVFGVVSRLVETDEAVFLTVMIGTIVVAPQVAQFQRGAAIVNRFWNREERLVLCIPLIVAPRYSAHLP
jgi:hypothetical protein